ncbi:hypothetical protein [Kitasatospora sp. McL0602]|uniref:hypothetical protein n=1 Tax=Kitasatospora sp. McL0602 TaxID=3439530 RepID=UPI003F8B06AD
MSWVEYYPKRYPGLHWEAADHTGTGFVLAETDTRGRIALANVNNPRNVLVGTPEELTALKDAFAAGLFDHLLAGPPTTPAAEIQQ